MPATYLFVYPNFVRTEPPAVFGTRQVVCVWRACVACVGIAARVLETRLSTDMQQMNVHISHAIKNLLPRPERLFHSGGAPHGSSGYRSALPRRHQ
jgi:hypothetical protein